MEQCEIVAGGFFEDAKVKSAQSFKQKQDGGERQVLLRHLR